MKAPPLYNGARRLGQKGALRLGVAVGLVVLEVGMALVAADAGAARTRYHALLQWDSRWYVSIVERGYHSVLPPVAEAPERSNVAFFPGYPVVASVIRRVLQVESGDALLIAAQVAAVAFWIYFILLLEGLDLPPRYVAAGVAAVAAYPTSFFLVAGYSESLFLASALGMIYWLGRPVERPIAAGLHGLVATATKLYGVVLVALPVIALLVTRGASRKRQGVGGPVAACLLTGLGAASFFAFCSLRFGRYDLYFESQRVGWGVVADLVAPFRPSSYALCALRALFPGFDATWDDPRCLNRSAVAVTLVILYVAARMCYGLRDIEPARFRTLLMLVGAAVGIFWLSVTGLASWGMGSMIRQTLPSIVFVVPIFLEYVRRRGPPPIGLRLALAILFGGSLALQLSLLWRYVRGVWVA